MMPEAAARCRRIALANTRSAKQIPIVMVAADALRGGLVDDLARPGANLTGLTLVSTELAAKRLERMRRL